MQKRTKTTNRNAVYVLKPGVYMTASGGPPGRVSIKSVTPVTIIESYGNSFVVAMIDSQTMILVHEDSVEEA